MWRWHLMSWQAVGTWMMYIATMGSGKRPKRLGLMMALSAPSSMYSIMMYLIDDHLSFTDHCLLLSCRFSCLHFSTVCHKSY